MISDVNIFAQKVSKIAATKKFSPFKLLFPPTSHSPMFKLFRFSVSLGKTNGKKWSQIWIFLLIKGVKLQRNKKVLFLTNFTVKKCFVSRVRDFSKWLKKLPLFFWTTWKNCIRPYFISIKFPQSVCIFVILFHFA